MRTSAERKQTDESLRVEREKADLALGEKLAAIDETADAVITLARARADGVLAASRAKTDRQPIDGQGARGATETIVNERLAADRALDDERAAADQTLQEEREDLERNGVSRENDDHIEAGFAAVELSGGVIRFACSTTGVVNPDWSESAALRARAAKKDCRALCPAPGMTVV